MEFMKEFIKEHVEKELSLHSMELELKNEIDHYNRIHLAEIHCPKTLHSVYICYLEDACQFEVWRGIEKEYHEQDYYNLSEFKKCLLEFSHYLLSSQFA